MKVLLGACVPRPLVILVLLTNDWRTIRGKAAEIAGKVATLKPGDFIELDLI